MQAFVVCDGKDSRRFNSATSHMEDKHKLLTPDDDYRDTEGCAGCIVSVLAVVIIFAIAAGLWLFTK